MEVISRLPRRVGFALLGAWCLLKGEGKCGTFQCSLGPAKRADEANRGASPLWYTPSHTPNPEPRTIQKKVRSFPRLACFLVGFISLIKESWYAAVGCLPLGLVSVLTFLWVSYW